MLDPSSYPSTADGGLFILAPIDTEGPIPWDGPVKDGRGRADLVVSSDVLPMHRVTPRSSNE